MPPLTPVQQKRRVRIFLCHSSEDKPTVRNLYHRLQADGFLPWLDEENLVPGQEWREEISTAVRASDVVVVCLSKRSLTKDGFVHKEIGFALDIAEEKAPGLVSRNALRIIIRDGVRGAEPFSRY
jgi:hypothetical protein